ncbi:alanine racemase [Ornithinibacillus sp. 4-3]|uniref:Alanine racemase n=1 Tax=Ornithinibacillus sp. 4-3 TaxID=3231488 RepID=A0AB39HL69_9BACI
MKKIEIDTPALVINRHKMMENLTYMQKYADANEVTLRPHTKTHKMPAVAKLQVEAGAKGIAVAKVGEAEVMAANGLTNIFIANQIVGEQKLLRIQKLAETINISFGIDSLYHVEEIEKVFASSEKKAQVLIEIEIGENRSGVIEEKDFIAILKRLKTCEHIEYKGIFSHDGHTYSAESLDACKALYLEGVERTLGFAAIGEEMGWENQVVSIGSTPPFMLGFGIPKGVTEIRPGTYIFMDLGQGNVLGTYERCAASVLTTVISKPTHERVITDVGAKGITMQTRKKGITKTEGLGFVKEHDNVHVHAVYDEHAIIYNEAFRNTIQIGDKIEIIPNHICPVSNLYDKAFIVEEDEVVDTFSIDGRGKLQ